jgi:RecA/RadA recombinase
MKVIETPITTAVIIYGPKGSGKTTHAAALAAHYGKSRIVDDFKPSSAGYRRVIDMPSDTLFILSGEGPERTDPGKDAFVHIYHACKAAGIDPHPMFYGLGMTPVYIAFEPGTEAKREFQIAFERSRSMRQLPKLFAYEPGTEPQRTRTSEWFAQEYMLRPKTPPVSHEFNPRIMPDRMSGLHYDYPDRSGMDAEALKAFDRARYECAAALAAMVSAIVALDFIERPRAIQEAFEMREAHKGCAYYLPESFALQFERQRRYYRDLRNGSGYGRHAYLNGLWHGWRMAIEAACLAHDTKTVS